MVSPTRRTTPMRRVSLSMKVPTLLLGTQISQTPDTGREAALKNSRRCWLSTGTVRHDMAWRRPEGKQEAREGESIFQQEEAWMTIEQEDTIVHPFVLRLLYSRQLLAEGA